MSVGSSGRLSFLGFLKAVAFDVEFEDDAVVYEPCGQTDERAK